MHAGKQSQRRESDGGPEPMGSELVLGVGGWWAGGMGRQGAGTIWIPTAYIHMLLAFFYVSELILGLDWEYKNPKELEWLKFPLYSILNKKRILSL
jgi:hypothetical protein